MSKYPSYPPRCEPNLPNIKREFVRGAAYLNYGLADCMPQSKFIKDIWVVKRKVHHYELAMNDVFNDLTRDHSRLTNHVGPDKAKSEFRQRWLHQCPHEQVRMLALFASLLSYGGYVETGSVKICVRGFTAHRCRGSGAWPNHLRPRISWLIGSAGEVIYHRVNG